MRARALLFGALVVAGVGMVTAAGPANAECIEVTLEVQRENAPSWYPLGGPASCVTNTPWNQSDEVHWTADNSPMPSGMPKGVWLQVWMVTP
jgi:hypothetical protein